MRERVNLSNIGFVMWGLTKECLYDVLFFSHIQQICSRQLQKYINKNNLKSVWVKAQLLKGDENVLANVEVAHYQQFLVLPQCFQKLSVAYPSK